MKIGIYDPYLDDLGGGEKYMITIALCLAEDHDVSIFWDSREDLNELSKRFILDVSKIKLTKNIFSSQVPAINRLKASRAYDLIITLSDGSVPFLLSKKTFLHIQQPLPGKSASTKTRLKLLKISGIFCNSYYTKFFVDKYFKTNSEVLYPPVGLKPKKIEKENIILHVGRFRVKDVVTKEMGNKVAIGDYKKQEFMIDTFKLMLRNGLKNWKFILAISVKKTDEKIFEGLRKKTKELPIEFVVNKNNDDLWEIYSKAKIYWHASGYGEDLGKYPEFAEHFGISTVEAMGAGVVPVAINAGGQKEIIEDRENGFLWNSSRELIDCTQELIEDNKLLKKMSLEAVKRAGKFAGERFCKDLYQILGK